MKIVQCAGCERPILDRFLLNVLDRPWHVKCVKCWDCKCTLTEKCFSRDGKLFCRADFFRRFGTKCGGCSQGISPTDLVRRARGKVFHLVCFTCLVCHKQLSTGEELYVLDENRFVCKEDYISTGNTHAPSVNSPLASPDFDESVDLPHGPVTPVGRDAERDSSLERDRELQNDVISGGSAVNSPSSGNPTGSTPPAAASGDAASCPSTAGPNDENTPGGTKRRGPRTTIKAKQLETLKAAFAATPKPTRHIREQLAQETGLNMRVIQVWFQNRRSKERRMKQLSNLGARRQFFRNPRRAMRPLRPGMSSDGMEDGSDLVAAPNSAYSYFSDSNSPSEFAYGAHPGFYDYFSGHPVDMPMYPGTIPIGPPVSSALEHPPPSNIISGVVNLGADAPYLTPSADFLSRRSSPESVLSLSATATDSYGAVRAVDSFPSLQQQPPISETPVW